MRSSTPAAERQRRYRARRRSGEPTLADSLVAAGRLKPGRADDRRAFNQALARFCRDWARHVEDTGRDPVQRRQDDE